LTDGKEATGHEAKTAHTTQTYHNKIRSAPARSTEVFPFDQAKVGLAYLEKGQAKGKVIVKVR